MNYKSLDCYINFVSGWVREVIVRKVNDKRVVIVKVSHACLDHQAIVAITGFNNVILLPIFCILPLFLIVSILSQRHTVTKITRFPILWKIEISWNKMLQYNLNRIIIYYYQVCYHGSSYCNLIYVIVPSSNFFS